MSLLLWYHWLLFILVNLIAAGSYFFISKKLYDKRRKTNTPLLRADSFLFEGFVFSCGLHHLFHPFIMLALATITKSTMISNGVIFSGMSLHPIFWGLFVFLLMVDSIMAAASLLAAKYMRLE